MNSYVPTSFSQHFQIPFHLSSFLIVPRQLRCFKSLSNKFFSNDNPCTSYAHNWSTTLYSLTLQFLIKWIIIWYFQVDSLQLNPRLREYVKPLPNWPLIWRATYISSYPSQSSIIFHHHLDIMNWWFMSPYSSLWVYGYFTHHLS